MEISIIASFCLFCKGVKKMGLSVKWDITYRCNLYCAHCLNGDLLNNSSEELSFQDVKIIIDNLINSIDVDYIHFLGGEPTVREDFIEICNYLNEHNINFGFNSNGLLLNDSKLSLLLQMKHLKTIVFSLDGPNQKINDEIRGKNVYNIILQRINQVEKYRSLLNNSNTILQINFVLSSVNHNYLKEMLTLCNQLPIQVLSILRLEESGNAVGKKFSLTNEETLSAIKDIAEFFTYENPNYKIIPKFSFPMVADYVEKCLHLKYPGTSQNCGAGSAFAFIDNKGNLYPCNRFPALISSKNLSLKNNDFWAIWAFETFSTPFSLSEGDSFWNKKKPCNTCSHLHKDCCPCYVKFSEETSDFCSFLQSNINNKEKVM